MQILSKISEILTGQKAEFALTDGGLWERWDMLRRNTRVHYTKDSILGAYAVHELVYACVNKIADVMNDAEIVVEQKNSKGEWVRKDGHLLTALLKRPNPYETGRDFRRLMVQSEQTAGIFYSEIVRSKAGLVAELHPLNPNRVQPKLNRDRSGIAYYQYTRGDGRRYEIKPENMLIRRRVDLTNRFFGLSPLSVALKSINSDLGLTDYVDAFFESDGTPSGILKILNATVNDTKKAAMQAQWQRKYSRGGTNQKGVAVLDQNADFQKIGSNLDELESEAISGRFESRICAVFGVPPNLVGAYVGLLHVTANATAKAELRNFWDNKISGELATWREWATWFLLPEFEDIELIKAEKVRVGYDISHVAFLQEEANDIHLRARDNFKAGGVTLNEFRQAIALPPDPEGDYYLQPFNLTALSPENRALEAFEKVPQGRVPLDPPQLTEGDEDEEEEPKRLVLSQKKKTFDLDGLTLAREPRGVEIVISLKTIAQDYATERERAVKLLMRFRDALIIQAAQEIEKLDVDTVHQLTLTPDPKTIKQLRKALEAAYRRGRAQIVDELNAQNAEKGVSPLHTKDERDDDPDGFLDDLSDIVISKIINEIQSRAVNIFVLLKMLLDYSVEKLTEALSGESTKFIEQIAGNVVNAAIRTGRDAEMRAQSDRIARYEYSAILDVNTCGPCEDADGMTADDPDDLPQAPNPECAGGPNCRCFRVAIVI